MGQVTHDQANLLLRLFELRRESRLRQAREWFVRNYNVATLQEATQKYPMGSEAETNTRMTISYWDMAVSFVNRGLIDEEMFFETSSEGWLVWDRIKEIAFEQRAAMKSPTFLAHLEKYAIRFEEWRERVAPGSIEVMRQRMTAMRNQASKAAS